MYKIINRIIISVLIINFILIFEMANIMFGQSAKIQFLKQSNVEQQQEKEVYITRTQELENIIKDSGIVVDECECEQEE